MPTALERLRLLGNAGTWIKVGRFEVNTSTGDRRPIRGLELGALPEDLNTSNPWDLETVWDDAKQAIAEVPGAVADSALYMANNNPAALAGQLGTAGAGSLLGMPDLSWEAQRAGQKEFKSDLLDPYSRSIEGISSTPVPSFSDDPVQSVVRGGIRSLPQTIGIALTGPAGAMLSGGNQADQSYEEMKSRGVPDYIAIPTSGLVGSAQGALDRIGAEGAFKGVAGNFLGRAAKGAAFEGLTETAQEGIGIAGESLTGKDQDYNLVKERLASALSGGIAVGGLLGGAPKIKGINKPAEVPLPVAHQEAAALEQKLFPARTVADYVDIAQKKGPYKAVARRLNDLTLEMDPDIKWEMLLDDQTDLALGREWQKIKTRVDADPAAGIVDVDLDGVKAGNDALGHDVADELIFKPSTDALHAVANKYGISPRLRIRKGGDEFRIVVPAGVAEQFAKDLQEAMPPKFIPLPPEAAATAGFPEGAYIQHGASIGWGSTSQEADQSMYRAKEVKPNRGALTPGQPPFVSQTQAEEQVIQHLAPRAPRVEPQALVPGIPKITEPGEAIQTWSHGDPNYKNDRYGEFEIWGNKVQAAIDHYEKVDPPLAVKMRRAFADKVQEYARSQGTSVPWEQDLLYDPGEIGPGQQRAIAAPVDEADAAAEDKPPISVREALAGSGALMGVPVDQVNAAIEGARGFLDKAVDIRQEYFTAEGNLPIPWMQAHENKVQTQRAAKLAVDFIVKDYGKALKAEMANGVLPEEMNSRAKKYLSGDQDVVIPEPMKPVLDRMRAYYDKNISQALIDSGVARDPAHVQEILENKGEYIFRAFKMHQPGWAEKMVGTPTFEKAVDYKLSKEDALLQRIVDSRTELAQEYEEKLAEIDAELQTMLAPADPSEVVPHGLQQEASRMNRDARQGAKQASNEAVLALREQYVKKLGIAKSRATWAQKKQAVNAANQNRRAEAAGAVEGMITFDPQPVHTGGFKGLSKSWLAKRKNIPREYLDVMGEIDDPATGLVVVAERAARSIGMKEMWDDIVLGSLGTDIFAQEMPGHVHKIEGVAVPGPDGRDIELYTSKKLHDALDHAFTTGHQAGGLWNLVMGANGILKMNATIFNPQGQTRNFESGLIALMVNGNLVSALGEHIGDAARLGGAAVGIGDRSAAVEKFKHGPFFDAFRTASAAAGFTKGMRQEALDAVRDGVIGTNVDTGDVARYMAGILGGPRGNAVKEGVRSAVTLASKLYAGGDNVIKLVARRYEIDRYAKAMGVSKDSPEVRARAAEVVKRTIQNYDRATEATKIVRDSVVFGPFVSFPMAVVQNVAGTYATIAEDLKSDIPAVRHAGLVRGAYALGTLGGLAFHESLSKFFKDEDDEDKRVLEDVRELVPSWMKNSMMMLWDRGPGTARVVDMSFLNYYDTVTRPIQMLMRGDFDSAGGAMLSIGFEMAKKIFGEELALSAYADLTRGPTSGGPKIFDEEMQGDVAFWRIGRYVLKGMAPGVIRSAARILEADTPQKRNTEWLALAGPRIMPINVPRALDHSLYDLQASRTAIRKSLQSSLKSTALLSMPEFEANVQGFQPSMQSIYGQALDKYQRAVRLGVSPQEARASMGDKMYRPGKIMTSLLNLGATPEVAVQRAVEYEWRGLKPDLLAQVGEKKKASLADYIQSHPGATQLSIERRRLELEDWGRQAISIINSQDQKPDPLEALRKFGAN